MKIAYLTNIPSPYRITMMEAWAAELGKNGISLTTYYTDEGDQGRGWAVRPTRGIGEVRLKTILSVPNYGRLNAGLFRMVRDNDVIVIGGFEQASYLAAALLGRVMGRKTVLLFDGFSPRRMATDPLHVHIVKRLTARLCDAFFANGRAGRDFLVGKLDVDPRRVFNQYLSVSTRDIDTEASKGLTRREWRTEFGLPQERPIAAMCGYLIERKRLDLAIDAVALMHPALRPMLLFIGRGPLKDALAAQAERLGVDVRFAGFQEGAQLARYYLASDFLILPSRDDAWGLVVNEAMAAGLPVICSDACGARLDLVEDGLTGYGFESGDADGLASAIEKLVKADMDAMGRAAKARISGWTPEHSAKSLLACIEALEGQPDSGFSAA